nr:hypothetical protein CFP56_60663 [Quercus suber]
MDRGGSVMMSRLRSDAECQRPASTMITGDESDASYGLNCMAITSMARNNDHRPGTQTDYHEPYWAPARFSALLTCRNSRTWLSKRRATWVNPGGRVRIVDDLAAWHVLRKRSPRWLDDGEMDGLQEEWSAGDGSKPAATILPLILRTLHTRCYYDIDHDNAV